MDEVWRKEFREEGGHDISEEDNALGDVGTDEVEGGREDDDIDDIVYQAWRC